MTKFVSSFSFFFLAVSLNEYLARVDDIDVHFVRAIIDKHRKLYSYDTYLAGDAKSILFSDRIKTLKIPVGNLPKHIYKAFQKTYYTFWQNHRRRKTMFRA